MFLSCVCVLEAFYAEVTGYMMRYIADDRVADLCRYQKDMICRPQREWSVAAYVYDWCDYFDRIFEETDPIPRETGMQIEFASYDFESFENYAREVVWYGKRTDRMIEKKLHVTGSTPRTQKDV